ncbi:MAG: helix-turn-helix domain-containing protein [Pseudomonadota bacterium]
MSEVITRSEMVAAMEKQYGATITESNRRDWSRMNMVVAKQGDLEVRGERLDFHMFELSLGGRHNVNARSEFENGERHQGTFVPGSMNYMQDTAQMYQTCEGEAHLQQIYIDSSIFTEVAQAIAPGDPGNLRPLGFQGVFDTRLKRIALDILQEARHPSAGGELYADALAQQLAVLLLRRRLNGQKERDAFAGKLGPDELTKVIEFMSANLEEPGGLDTVAQIAGLDVFSFSRAFKAATGEAPHQFLIKLRIIRAQELLAHSNDSIAEIAYSCGFASQSHMTATFRKHLGITPRSFRREVTR